MSDLLDSLIARAEGWAAEDPDPSTKRRARGAHLGPRRGRPRRPLRRDAGVRHGWSPRCARRGVQPDEPRRRHPGGRRPGGVPQGHRCPAGASVVIGYDARHNSDVFARDTAEVMTGAGLRALVMPRPLPTPAAGVRDPRARLRRRRDGDREPQPAAGQRLQGLPRRRQPDRAAGRRRDRRAHRRGRRAGRRPSRRPRQGPDGGHRRPLPRHRRRPGRRRAARPADRLHAAARRRRHVRAAGAGDRRLRGAVGGRAAGGARPGVPDRGVPEPRGARRDGPRDGAGRGPSRRPGRRQRPGRRPVRGRRTEPARLADAARRRGRRAAGPPPALAGQAGHLRVLDRVVVAARQDGGGARAAVRRDADRLQVDQPGRGAGVRLRGGAGLLRRPRAREGQGRRLGAAAPVRAGRRAEGRRAAD